VDDIALILVSLPDPVPSGGQFYQALLGTFSQAPKGWVHHLPDDYTGERHIVTVRREPRSSPNVEWGQFEERPGPAPPGLEDPGCVVYLTPDEMNI
jgi:hypothetical protein